ncbi:hypothetical protein C0Q70_12415 [Pomacea canaliculata]|uniref:Uncharacterized protein n=1 Tax=Pomacea canaliculata TaxID=400727 RepID=A0A2T7P1I0_POMCA|nr:hypothetical protein C0Q70_12415 [Pomacea canaliculata]
MPLSAPPSQNSHTHNPTSTFTAPVTPTTYLRWELKLISLHGDCNHNDRVQQSFRLLTNHGEDARAASSAYREPDAVWVRRIYMLAAKITRGHNPLTRQIQARGVIYYRDRFVWNNVSIRHTPTTRKAGDDTAKRAGEC